jgi:hypothetical protein
MMLTAALVIAMSLTVAPTAAAHTASKSDGNDTKGPLDLASVSVEHTTDGGLVYTFKTLQRWIPRDLGQRSYLALLFDTDEDGDIDRCAFIYRPALELRGLLTDCARHEFGTPPVEKTGRRTAQIVLTPDSVGRTHRWGAISFYERDDPCNPSGCLDAVPNRGLMFHDLVAPTAAWVTSLGTPYSTFTLSSTTSVPVEFSFSDKDTKVKAWTVQQLVSGEWIDLATGAASGGGAVTDLPLEEGRSFYLRVAATDKQDNVGVSPTMLMNVPYDDDHAIASYSAGWSTASGAAYFQGGYHTTSTTGASMIFTFNGQAGINARIMGGPGNGTATVTDENGGTELVSETPSYPAGGPIVGYVWGSNGTHTLTVTVTSGTFIIDGLSFTP